VMQNKVRSYYKTIFRSLRPTICLSNLTHELTNRFIFGSFYSFLYCCTGVSFRIFYYFLRATLFQLAVIALDQLDQL